MDNYQIALFLGFFWAGVANAVMDILNQNFTGSIFMDIKNLKIAMWFASFHRNKPTGWRRSWFMAWTWDGWHHFKFQEHVATWIFVPICAFSYQEIHVLLGDLVVGAIIWTIAHELFLHRILVR